MAALDLEDSLFVLAPLVYPVEEAVNAAVGAALCAAARGRPPYGLSRYQANGPILDLEGILRGKGASGIEVARNAEDGVVAAWFEAEGVAQAALHDGNGEVRDVNADPLSAETLCGDDSGATAAERVKDEAAIWTRRGHNAVEDT